MGVKRGPGPRSRRGSVEMVFASAASGEMQTSTDPPSFFKAAASTPNSGVFAAIAPGPAAATLQASRAQLTVGPSEPVAMTPTAQQAAYQDPVMVAFSQRLMNSCAEAESAGSLQGGAMLGSGPRRHRLSNSTQDVPDMPYYGAWDTGQGSKLSSAGDTAGQRLGWLAAGGMLSTRSDQMLTLGPDPGSSGPNRPPSLPHHGPASSRPLSSLTVEQSGGSARSIAYDRVGPASSLNGGDKRARPMHALNLGKQDADMPPDSQENASGWKSTVRYGIALSMCTACAPCLQLSSSGHAHLAQAALGLYPSHVFHCMT